MMHQGYIPYTIECREGPGDHQVSRVVFGACEEAEASKDYIGYADAITSRKERRTAVTNRQSAHGAARGSQYYGVRVMDFTLSVFSLDNDLERDWRVQKLLSVLRISPWGRQRILFPTHDGILLSTEFTVTEEPVVDMSDPYWKVVRFTAYCEEPLFRSAAARLDHETRAGGDVELSIAQPGDAEASIERLRIDGPVTNPTVTIAETGQQLVFGAYAGADLVIGAGQWLDIDTARGTVLVNGAVNAYKHLSFSGSTRFEEFTLSPRANTLVLGGSAQADGQTKLSATWRGAWA